MLISKHAKSSFQSRGIKNKFAEFVLFYGDVEVPVGRGLTAVMFSNRGLQRTQKEFGMSGAEADRLRNLVLLENGTVVTGFRADRNRGKQYRHPRRGYSPRMRMAA
jgi:hypothetical protein